MAWTTTLVTRVRYVIGDIGLTQSFTDAQLQTLVAIAASFVMEEVAPPTTFTVDTDTPEISPDPLSNPNYHFFAVLIVLKAACIAAKSEIRRDVAKFGIMIKDDLATYDARNISSLQMETYKALCDDYEGAKFAYDLEDLNGRRAIVGGAFSDSDAGLHWWNHRHFTHYVDNPSRF